MLKAIKAFSVACISCLIASPVLAGPYLNIENNAGWDKKGKGTGHGTDIHVGIEGTTGALGWNLQGGPYLSNPATGSNSTDLSAKTGFSVAATESLSVYGELSGVFADDASYGSKAGLKWNF